MDIKTAKRERRHKKIRTKIKGTGEVPRLAVFRSNRYVYAELIDDDKQITLAHATSLKSKGATVEKAKKVGLEIAEKAKALKIGKVVFDRAGFIYTGKIKAIADGAREGGLTF